MSSPYRRTATKKYVRRPTSQTATYTDLYDERLLSIFLYLFRGCSAFIGPAAASCLRDRAALLLAAVRSCRSLFDCAAAAHAAKLFVVWCAGFGNDRARPCAYSYGCTSAESLRNFSPARRTPHASPVSSETPHFLFSGENEIPAQYSYVLSLSYSIFRYQSTKVPKTPVHKPKGS